MKSKNSQSKKAIGQVVVTVWDDGYCTLQSNMFFSNGTSRADGDKTRYKGAKATGDMARVEVAAMLPLDQEGEKS